MLILLIFNFLNIFSIVNKYVLIVQYKDKSNYKKGNIIYDVFIYEIVLY